MVILFRFYFTLLVWKWFWRGNWNEMSFFPANLNICSNRITTVYSQTANYWKFHLPPEDTHLMTETTMKVLIQCLKRKFGIFNSSYLVFKIHFVCGYFSSYYYYLVHSDSSTFSKIEYNFFGYKINDNLCIGIDPSRLNSHPIELRYTEDRYFQICFTNTGLYKFSLF